MIFKNMWGMKSNPLLLFINHVHINIRPVTSEVYFERKKNLYIINLEVYFKGFNNIEVKEKGIKNLCY